MSTARFTAPQPPKATALDLAAIPVLAALEPERLAEIAERTELIRTQGDSSPNLKGRVAFVLEGIYDVVAEGARRGTASVCSETLGPGDWFGGLWTDAPTGLTLASRGAGRLALIRASRLRALQGDWPDLLQAFARDGERRQIALAKGLLADREKLADTDRVLSRIDSVANLLVQGGVGGRTLVERVQRKFRLTAVPDLPAERSEIEQAYLRPEDGVDEDRIRRVTKGKEVLAVRTRRRNVGQNRVEFDEKLSERDFERLLAQIDGRVIRKTRLTLRDHPTLAIDVFKEPEAGLVILEATFPDAAKAGTFNAPDEVAPLVTEEVTRQSQYSNRAMADSAGQKSIATNPVS